MNTQHSQLTQPEIDALIEQLTKNFDITKIQNLSYNDIQKLADKYLTSEDQGFKEIGEELKTIDPKVFELSPAESALKQLHDIVIKLGKSKTEADKFGISILKVATESTVQEIIGAMSPESKDEWENLQSFEPNVLQQSYLLNETSKMLLNKTFDELYESNLDKAVKLAAMILTGKRDNSEIAKSLTEEQSKTVLTAFNANQYEIAIQLIYNFVQNNAATIGS